VHNEYLCFVYFFIRCFWVLELISLMIGTNSEIIMKLALNSSSGPGVELISQGPLGSQCKLSGTRTWHRIPSSKHLEWLDLRISSQQDVWIEISDGRRLVKVIDSLISLAGAFDRDSFHCQIGVEITGTEMKLKHATSNSSFTLPVRWFDAKWAAGTILLPPASFPGVCVKLLGGLDQIAAILKRISRWRDDWSVDLLTLEAVKSGDMWDLNFIAETSTPPHVKLCAKLANCPEYRIATASNAAIYRPCSVSVSLAAATRALIVPLAENSRLCASTALVLSWMPGEALVCHINWNAVGFGPIATTIYIPSRLE
jgi:hypothetical protein